MLTLLLFIIQLTIFQGQVPHQMEIKIDQHACFIYATLAASPTIVTIGTPDHAVNTNSKDFVTHFNDEHVLILIDETVNMNAQHSNYVDDQKHPNTYEHALHPRLDILRLLLLAVLIHRRNDTLVHEDDLMAQIYTNATTETHPILLH